MARYNPSNDPNFNPQAQPGVGNAESPYNPQAQDLYWGGHAGGAQEDVNRYRGQAQGARDRAAYQTDLNQYNQARGASQQGRGVTLGALGGIGAIARGEAPSAAQIQGQQFLDTSLQNQLAAAGSVRGGPSAQAAAYRNAATQGAGIRQRGLADINALRAQEQANAYNALVQGGLGLQGQDINQQNADLGAAGLKQQSELQQRQLNQAGEQFYEGLGFGTKTAQLGAGMGRQQMADARAAAHRQAQLETEAQDWGKKKDIISMVTGPVSGALGGLFGSDPRLKMNMGPVGMPGSANPMWSPPEAKKPARIGPPADVDKAAEKRVKGRRRVGGYGVPDETPPSYAPLTDEQLQGEPEIWGGANPYVDRTPPEPGVAGAPRNYAGQREGQPGAMDFSPAVQGTGHVAPGMDDWARYGDPDRMTEQELARREQLRGPEKPGTLERMARGFVGGLGRLGPQRPIYMQAPPGQIPSGMAMKMPSAAGPAMAAPTFSGGSGMLGGSPMGELKAHSDYATRFTRNAGSGPVGRGPGIGPMGMAGGGMFPSDKAAKEAAYKQGVKDVSVHMATAPAAIGATVPFHAIAHAPSSETVSKAIDAPKIMERVKSMPGAAAREVASEVKHDMDQPAGWAGFYGPSALVQDVASRPRYTGNVSLPRDVKQDAPVALGRPAMTPAQGQAVFDTGAARSGVTSEPMWSPPEAKNVVRLDWRSRLDRAQTEEAGLAPPYQERSPADFEVHDIGREAKRIRRESEDRASKEADDLMNQYQGSLASSPEVGVPEEREMKEANRALVASSYEYKPEFRPKEQAPGEVNVGPMADRMAADNVAGTAVRRMPNGLLAIDRDKGLKLVMGGLSSLQRQLDELKKTGTRGGR